MPGPSPKSPETRQRKNKRASAAEIETTRRRAGRVPPLKPYEPKREWDERTRRWWRVIWESPMATRWLRADQEELGALAILKDQFYKQPSAGLAAEIRLQSRRFGLTPEDRAKLDWVMLPPASVEERDERRKSAPQRAYGDPRDYLEVMEGGKG